MLKFSISRRPRAAIALADAGRAASVTEPAAITRPAVRAGTLRAGYLAALTWSFTLFNSVRALAYLPTLWTIYASGDSSQHSLWTWVTWLGANATMAAWLFEHNGGRCNRAVVVNIANASMCLLTVLMILRFRL